LAAKERQSRAALRLAEARVQEARATVVETRSKLTRLDALIAKRLASAEEHDTLTAAHARAVSGVAVADAQTHQARAQLEYDQRLLEKAVVHAPISGIVLKRQVEPGQTVAAALQTPVLFTLAKNLTQMELHVQVDEADVGKVVTGQTAEFVVDAYPNRRFPAVITLVRYVPQTVDGVVTYETLLAVDNSDLLLRPGMTVTAEILIKEHTDVLRVPNAALRFAPPASSAESATAASGTLVGRLLWRPPAVQKRDPSKATQGARVWTLRDGVPAPLSIETGATDGIMTEITAGELVAGTAIIVEAVSADSASR
jgi:HlyD family secretion protein